MKDILHLERKVEDVSNDRQLDHVAADASGQLARTDVSNGDFDSAEFGELLRALRRGRSQMSVAEASGVPQHTISAYERGEIQQPSFVVICKLAKHYEVSPNDMAALAGLYPPPADDDESYPPDVSRELQFILWMMTDLRSPSLQRKFAKLLREAAGHIQSERERLDLVSNSKLPAYIRRKIAPDWE
jgi:transcriptional regulator with XRE-family HTH domain